VGTLLLTLVVPVLAGCGGKDVPPRSGPAAPTAPAGPGSGPTTPAGPAAPDGPGNPSGPTVPGGPAGPVATALARLAVPRSGPVHVSFGDIAALRRLRAGPAGVPWNALSGVGIEPVAQLSRELPGRTGIDLDRAAYAVVSGQPPATLGLVAGGQDPGAVTAALLRGGWRQDGDVLRRAPSAEGDPTVALLSIALSQVRTGGDDVVYGASAADLSSVVRPVGATPAAEPDTIALLACLGDVVAAEIDRPAPGGADAVAVGVPRPAPGGSGRTVICTTWPSAAAAARGAAAQQASARSAGTAGSEVLAGFLRSARVEPVGGARNVVRLTADSAENPALGLALLVRGELPGLSRRPGR